ncbi:MAG: SPFH domain-containing protein [Patescibacteria group bacterium]
MEKDGAKLAPKRTFGFKVVPSGGGIVIPFVENFAELSTTAFQINIDEQEIPNKDNVPINVKGVATCKIGTAPEDLMNAAENFLGKSEDEIHKIVQNILQGHNRSIIGNLDIDGLLRKRDEYNKKVVEESKEELKRLGIEIVTLVIQEVKDAEGYIDALGKKAVAEAKKDAAIKVAEADRDTAIKTSDAAKEAATVKAKNEALIAEAEKDRDIKKAQFQVSTANEVAKAETAKSIALAAQQEQLKIAEAKRDAAGKQAQIAVEEKEAERKKAELNASIIMQAEANRKQIEINADAARKKIEIEAEAAKRKRELEAEALAIALKTEAEGKKDADTLKGEGEAALKLKVMLADADGQRAILLAQAEGKKQGLLADAEGKKQYLLAEAEGKKQGLLADADGAKAMNVAMMEMSEAAKLLLILDRLPRLLEEAGEAGSKVMESIFRSTAAGLSNIDNISIVDLGGGKNGEGSIERMSTLVPNIIFKVFTQMKALKMDITGFLEKIGIKPDEIEKLLPGLKLKEEHPKHTTVEA